MLNSSWLVLYPLNIKNLHTLSPLAPDPLTRPKIFTGAYKAAIDRKLAILRSKSKYELAIIGRLKRWLAAGYCLVCGRDACLAPLKVERRELKAQNYRELNKIRLEIERLERQMGFRGILLCHQLLSVVYIMDNAARPLLTLII